MFILAHAALWYYNMHLYKQSGQCQVVFHTKHNLTSFVCLYPPFIFCTTLYDCLGFLSLNSSSIAINCWLITRHCSFLHAVYAHFLFSSYSAPFALISLAKHAWYALFFCSSSHLHSHQTIPYYPCSFPYIPVCQLLCFSYLF